MYIDSESKSIIETKKIIQNKFFTIYFSRNNISILNNFENLFIVNFEKFDNLFSNKFKNFL